MFDRKAYMREYSLRNRERLYARRRELGRDQERARLYGLSYAEFMALEAAAEGLCEGCVRPFNESRKPNIDHCHVTGRVRGLLCGECNRAIGHVSDCPDRLERLAAYLRSGMAKQKPKFRLSISNRDKSERTFTDYKGEEVTKKYQSIGAIFYNAEDDRWFIASDVDFKFVAEKHWLNIFAVEEDDDSRPSKGSKAAKPGKGKPAKKVKKAPQPEDRYDEDDDGVDPFASDEE